MSVMIEEKLVDEKKAAEILGLAVQTLRNYRHLGRPPAYVKFGRAIRYPLNDLFDFITKNRIDPEGKI